MVPVWSLCFRDSSDARSVSVALALSDIRLFHGCMLLAAVHLFWLEHPVDVIHEAFLHHKLEAISLVTSHLEDPIESRSDATVGAIACLALSEVCHTTRQGSM